MDARKRYLLLVDDGQNITNALQRELEDWSGARGPGLIPAISAPDSTDDVAIVTARLL